MCAGMWRMLLIFTVQPDLLIHDQIIIILSISVTTPRAAYGPFAVQLLTLLKDAPQHPNANELTDSPGSRGFPLAFLSPVLPLPVQETERHRDRQTEEPAD